MWSVILSLPPDHTDYRSRSGPWSSPGSPTDLLWQYVHWHPPARWIDSNKMYTFQRTHSLKYCWYLFEPKIPFEVHQHEGIKVVCGKGRRVSSVNQYTEIANKGLRLRVDARDSYRSCNLSRKGLLTLTVQTNYWGWVKMCLRGGDRGRGWDLWTNI